MTKKLLKFLKWTAIVLIGAPVLIYLAWLTGNIHHDELSPELTSLLARRPVQMNEKDNAYFDTIGLAAPANMEPHAWGVAWFAQASANDRAVNEGKAPTPIKLDGYPPTFKTGNLPCSRKDSAKTCLAEVAADTTAAQKGLRTGATLLKRFDAVLDKGYQEPSREFVYLSEFSPRAPEHQAINLALIRIALEFAQGHNDAALTRWKKETTFILHQATHSQNLIDQMVFNSALSRYQRLLADYLSTHPRFVQSKSKQILDLLEPFNKEAVTLQSAFEGEAIISARFITSPQGKSGFLSGADSSLGQRIIERLLMPFFDRFATANDMANQQLEWSRTATLEGAPYRAAIAKMAAEPPDPMSVMLSYHNPVGKILVLIGNVDYSKYLYRSDNIIANKKLIAFAVGLIARKSTGTEQVAQAINTNRADLEHPFTGELPVWNAEKRTLSYPYSTRLDSSRNMPLAIKL